MEEGQKVIESPVGSGVITDFTERGLPRVNDVAVAWLRLEDGTLFDPFRQYEKHKAENTRPRE